LQDKHPHVHVRAFEDQHLGDKAVHPELMQEQLDADAEALRARNYPDRKSHCGLRAGRRSHEEKEKGGNDEEGDSRRTRRRVFDSAEISQQGINESHG
jgi:hypothetical protein